MSPFTRRFAVVVTALALALVGHAAENQPKPPPIPKPGEQPKDPNTALRDSAGSYHTTYLNPPVEIAGVKAYQLALLGGDEAGIFLRLDPNLAEVTPFGGSNPITEVAERQIKVTFKLIPAKPEHPAEFRKRYAIEGEGVAGRLVLVIPADRKGTPVLVVHGRDGKPEAAHPLLYQEYPRIKP